MAASPESCDSCTAPTREDDLIRVERVWFDEEMEPSVQQGIERWCSGCRDTYPHRVVEQVGGAERAE